MVSVEEQQANGQLVIDFSEEGLCRSDIRELLHECMHNHVLLCCVPTARSEGDEWHRLGEELGWDVQIDGFEISFSWKAK